MISAVIAEMILIPISVLKTNYYNKQGNTK